MNILFLHNNFPGQFSHLATHLASCRSHRVVAIGGSTARQLPGVPLHRYRLMRGTTPSIQHLALRYEADCLRGEAAAGVALELKRRGYRPDVIVGHVGWGETLFMKDVWPDARIMIYAEYYYRSRGGDVGFDPEFGLPDTDMDMRVRAKNGAIALAVAEADLVYAPTEWQRSRFPESLRRRIAVVHDGIDTEAVRPAVGAHFHVSGTNLDLTQNDEVITYVNRHLEPTRGIHTFLRAAAEILRMRPSAHILVVGDSRGRPYGAPPPSGRSWKDHFLEQVGHELDKSRLHWLGRLDRKTYLLALAVSRAHIYLTRPFVLSWSLLEAMSAGCVIVASDTAPVREVIENERNGLLVDFFDHRKLAQLVADITSRPPGAFAQLTCRARKSIVDHYDRDSICLPRLVEMVEGLGGS